VPYSRSAYASRERRAQRDRAFDIAATLELHLKSLATKNAMLTLLNTWLYAAEQQDLSTRQAEYVHAVRYAIDVVSAATRPEAAIELLRETEPNVWFIVAAAQPASARSPVATAKEDLRERFVFEKKSGRWTWRCVNQNRETVRAAERSFTYYLDCCVDAKMNGFAGRPLLVPVEEVQNPGAFKSVR
jgi:hypothetical protein